MKVEVIEKGKARQVSEMQKPVDAGMVMNRQAFNVSVQRYEEHITSLPVYDCPLSWEVGEVKEEGVDFKVNYRLCLYKNDFDKIGDKFRHCTAYHENCNGYCNVPPRRPMPDSPAAILVPLPVKEVAPIDQREKDTIIAKAANCVYWLNEIIRGFANGKNDELIELDYRNLADCYKSLLGVPPKEVASKDSESGFKYDYKFLVDLKEKLGKTEWGEGLGLEEIEAVLLAVNYHPSTGVDADLWETMQKELIDILYYCNGTGSGAEDIVAYLQSQFTITRKSPKQ